MKGAQVAVRPMRHTIDFRKSYGESGFLGVEESKTTAQTR
jgi:hypothetical protein